MSTDDKYGQSKPFDTLNTRGLAAKRELVRELEQRGDEKSIAQLVEFLSDESWYQRDLAEQALMRLGARGATQLRPLLRQGLWYTRASAARILGRIGYGDAVPDLFRLMEDANSTVETSGLDALLEIGHQRGAIRLAHAMHRLPPDMRQLRMSEFTKRDPNLGERLRRFLRADELMGVEDASQLDDDSAAVRATEEGVEWEVLTGPPQSRPGSASNG